MLRRLIVFLAAGLPMAAVLPALAGQEETAVQTTESVFDGQSGDSLYRTYCVACHGGAGRGDGVLASSLRVRPADLSHLMKKGEKFDAERVAKIIDGRKEVAGHGNSDMPKWGDAFKRSGEGYSDKVVKARIDALTAYLETLQAR